MLEVKTFNFSKADIPVGNAAGEELKLSDVPAEGLVILKLNAAEDVVSIIAPLPTVRGYLTAVDPKGGKLVLSLSTGPEAIATSPQTKIYLDAKSAALKDLNVGHLTSVTFTRDHKSVVEVRSGKGIGAYLPAMRRLGVLIDVDRDKRLARIFRSNPKGDVSVLREWPLAKDATFSLNYQRQPVLALKLEEITKGFDVTYWVDQVYNRVVHIDLDMPLLAQRKVKAIDRENRSITILDGEGERVLTLSPRVQVLSKNRPGKLEEVVPGVFVDCGLNPDRKHVEFLALTGSP